MEFLAPEGPQFYFKGLVDGGAMPFTAVLGSNLSAPAEWFRPKPFDERFTEACLEDTELAWRWPRRGWTAICSAGARCLHRHRYDTIEPVLDRQRRAGRWARLAVATHPAMLPRLVLQPIAFSAVAALRSRCAAVSGTGGICSAGSRLHADFLGFKGPPILPSPKSKV